MKDQLQSIKYSINDFDNNVTDPEALVFWWFRFYHIICRHFTIVCF